MKTVHPSSTARSPRPNEWETNQVPCSMCGFVNDTREAASGGTDTIANTTSSYTFNGLTRYWGNFTVNSGCSFCGSPQYKNRPRRLRGGRTYGSNKIRLIS